MITSTRKSGWGSEHIHQSRRDYNVLCRDFRNIFLAYMSPLFPNENTFKLYKIIISYILLDSKIIAVQTM